MASMIIPQRIDNDVDTDEEQIKCGIKKLHKFLLERCEEEKIPQEDMEMVG